MNVLLICVDALRVQNLSCYNYPIITTPFLNKFIEECTVFTNFFSPTNITDSSISSLFTGLMPSRHGVIHEGGNVTLEEETSIRTCEWLPEVLMKNGYYTMAVDWLGRWHKRGFQYYSLSDSLLTTKASKNNYHARYILHKMRTVLVRLKRIIPRSIYNKIQIIDNYIVSSREKFKNGEAITNEAIELINNNKGNKWFLFLHYWDAHTPYENRLALSSEYIDEYHKLYDFEKSKIQFDRIKGPIASYRKWYKGSLLESVRAYDECIHYVDNQINVIINYLRKNSLLEDTVIIIVSDHGESLIEHNIFFDHHGLYDVSVRCPLIIRFPGRKANVINEFVQHTDIMPTIMEYFNIGHHISFDGCSLMPLIEGRSDKIREVCYLEEHHTQDRIGLRTDKYKYIKDIGGQPCRYCDVFHGASEELYYLIDDPWELNNISLEQPKIKEKFEKKCMKLFDKLQDKKNNRLRDYDGAYINNESELDAEEREIIYRRLKKLGYIT